MLIGHSFFLQLVFEGVRGNSYTGDIAVDDVLIRSDGACPTLGSCDFEDDFCTYGNDEDDDDFDWERNSGTTFSVGTGPSKDHTYLTKNKGTDRLKLFDLIWFVFL